MLHHNYIIDNLNNIQIQLKKKLQNTQIVFEDIEYIFEKRIFGPIYNKYLHENWPIVSTISPNKENNIENNILNVAFPDYSIIYYVASFKSTDNITLEGEIPPNIYFWSLTLYNNKGTIIHSINDREFINEKINNDRKYKIGINNSKIQYNDITENLELSKDYCIIQRVYKTDKTPTISQDFISQDFLPNISIKNKENKEIEIKDVNDEERKKDSNKLQSLLYKLFNHKFGKIQPEIFFKGVDVHKFFLPAKSQMSLVFPNPFAEYLIAFPTKSQVMKITGKLPKNIGFSNPEYRFLSFMACDFKTTATDECISHHNLPQEPQYYTIYVSFSEKNAENYGYKKTLGHKLLLWNSETNTFPVLIFRIVSVAEPETGIFAIDNDTKIVSGYDVKKKIGDFYPEVECFKKI